MYSLKNVVSQANSCRDRLANEIRMTCAFCGLSSFHRRVLSRHQGHQWIAALFRDGRPFMVSRIGMLEGDCAAYYWLHRKAGLPYSARTLRVMPNNTGFFPASEEALDRFSALYLKSVKSVDVMGVWVAGAESSLCREFCPQAALIDWRGLEPYYHRKPWSAALADKKVVVVHPFAGSIAKQYRQARTHLFKDPSVLPEFELRTVRAVQSLANAKTGFKDWFEAIGYMQREIVREDFDVALIGAGAYGLPLAAYVKSLGKTAVHLGGPTQLLFGIKGQRWDHYRPAARMYNEYWVRPAPEETPSSADKVEGGCYW